MKKKFVTYSEKEINLITLVLSALHLDIHNLQYDIETYYKRNQYIKLDEKEKDIIVSLLTLYKKYFAHSNSEDVNNLINKIKTVYQNEL